MTTRGDAAVLTSYYERLETGEILHYEEAWKIWTRAVAMPWARVSMPVVQPTK